jgi:monovalent cation:H+ antiporter-2, CPA2 family
VHSGDHFLTNLGIALLAAMVGGFAARLFKMPLLVGYILAGIVVGPHTPGVTADSHAVHEVARLGVALLMFAVGVQFHLEDMLAVRKIALVGGGIQIGGTILLGWLVGLALGWGHYGGLFLGCALALSSTAVMMRILEERGELGTSHGTVMLGILVVQDLAVVVMVTLLPSLATLAQQGTSALAGLALSILRAGVSVTLALLLARRWIPALLQRAARLNSPELFLILVVCVCLGAAYLAQLAGLSLEIGAFLAGLVISESDYAHEVFSQIRPVRDIFASLFFVSVGMLLDPQFLAGHVPAVLAVVATILVGKALLSGIPIYALGAHGKTAIFAGLGLAQIGEFSFILASMGSDRKLIPVEEADVILSAALITMLLTPVVYGASSPVYGALTAIPSVSRLLNREHGKIGPAHHDGEVAPRVVLLGCGRVGKHVSQALSARDIPHVVVEYDATVVARLRSVGIPVVYGDATSDSVLAEATTESIELAVVALPEESMTPMAVRQLRHLYPGLPIIARVHHGINIPRLRAAGADDVVHAEFEAATMIIRHGLARLGCDEPETEEYLGAIRRERYRHA